MLKHLCLIACIWSVSLAALAQDYVPGEVIVKLKSQAGSESTYAFFGKAQSQKQMLLQDSYEELNLYRFAFQKGTVDSVIADLKNDPNVEYAEPNFIFSKAPISGQSTTYSYDDVQGLSGGGSYLATGAPIYAPETWATLSVGAAKPIVAVIDTGLDTTHAVFTQSQAVWTNPYEIAGNGIDDDGNGYIDDVHGWNFVNNSGTMYDDDDHGTHVAGIILGVTEDIYTSPFAESKIKIMPLKFLDSNGTGKTSDAIKAIYYAVNNGAKVINNSWGGPQYSGALHEAIAYSYSRGVSFVAAAGNNGANNDGSPIYPASYDVPNVISVAATTDSDFLASFSNFGASSVDLGSPGQFILSTAAGGGYFTLSGTSMAAPFVSGVAALMLVESPQMLGYQIKQIIFANSDPVGSLNSKVYTHSRVNVLNSVTYAKTASVMSTQPAYSFSNQDRELASALASGGGCGLVTKMYSDFNNGRGPRGMGGAPSSWYVIIFIGFMTLPFFVVNYLRSKRPESRRRHPRYKIDSDVSINVGGERLVGSISSISMGGVQLNTNALIEEGGIVSMSITSPDGTEQIQVEGQVVWRAADKAYGVQFANAKSAVTERIGQWTKKLVKLT